MSWEYREDALGLIDELSPSFEIVALEQAENASSLLEYRPDPTKKYALVLGNEVKGVRQEILDKCGGVVEIPQYGTKHSLNISVSAGIAVWQFFSALHGR